MKLFPVVVEIENPGPYGDVTQAKPDWLNQQLRPSTARLFLGGVRGANPGWYFLPPKWRKGNRITFNVKGNQTLIPVRYRPDWQLWENDSANSSLLLGLGVRFSHLRRAIELAQMCRNTEGKPKVGAVIIKGGEKVAEAYRGEDDTDRHAEEIAMSKCTKSNSRILWLSQHWSLVLIPDERRQMPRAQRSLSKMKWGLWLSAFLIPTRRSVDAAINSSE